MTKAIDKMGLFKSPRSKAETKADVTDNAARAITETEAAKRDAKTAKLREARLAREALEREQAPVVVTSGSKKPARKK